MRSSSSLSDGVSVTNAIVGPIRVSHIGHLPDIGPRTLRGAGSLDRRLRWVSPLAGAAPNGWLPTCQQPASPPDAGAPSPGRRSERRRPGPPALLGALGLVGLLRALGL